jgi:predicted metal-dependent peptidase
LYGRKQTGEDTLKTIVAAVDTSGSISKKQIKIFINEIMYLVKTFDCEKTVIIYCSDQVDAHEILKKGQEPDFTKIKSTGGNSQGFDPPFQWVEENKIKPSIFIYMTDTGGSMPDPNKYGIRKYIKKVFWFICSTKLYNKPPFGRIFMAPPSAIDSSFDPF